MLETSENGDIAHVCNIPANTVQEESSPELDAIDPFDEYWMKFGEQLVWNSWVEKYEEYLDSTPYAPAACVEEEVIACVDSGSASEQGGHITYRTLTDGYILLV